MQSSLVDVHVAAKILGISERRILQLFKEGRFKTARQITVPRGWWKVSRYELLEKTMPQSQQYYE